MNAKMGWLIKPSGLVELKGLLDGHVEGADQNGVKYGMKMTPETKVVTNVATMATTDLTWPSLAAALTMTAMSMAAMPSAAKSTNGDVVVIWITAAEIRPMMSA